MQKLVENMTGMGPADLSDSSSSTFSPKTSFSDFEKKLIMFSRWTNRLSKAGLPDFSCYKIPKPVKMYQKGGTYTKWP
jgi:hypothetical protein